MIKKTKEETEINSVIILVEVQGKVKEWSWFKTQILVITVESSRKKSIIEQICFKEAIQRLKIKVNKSILKINLIIFQIKALLLLINKDKKEITKMIVILSGSKSDTSINNNLKKEKKRFKQKISKKNAVRVKIIIKISNFFVMYKIIMLFRQKILIIIRDVLKQIFKFTTILIKIMIQTYKAQQVVWIAMVVAIANLMI